MSRAKNKRRAAMARRKSGPVRSLRGVPLSEVEAAAKCFEIDREMYDSAFNFGLNMLGRGKRS